MNAIRFAAVLMILILCSACATLPNGQLWGENATIHPAWARVEDAARHAALSPLTWAPLAGAAVFKATNWDKRVSKWALDNHPIFGSTSNADNASDDLAYAAGGIYGLTALATSDGSETGPWFTSKVRGGAVGGAAILAAMGTTEALKDLSHRPRPDHSDDKSFPSGHATGTTAVALLASRNLDSLSLDPGTRIAANVGLGGLVAATDWARIEAGKHYPSDVLVGTAIGGFVSAVANDAFLGLGDNSPVHTTLDVSRHEVMVGLAGQF